MGSESFDALVARVSASAYIMDEAPTAADRSTGKRLKKSRKHRLMKHAEKLNKAQLAILLELIEGGALLTVLEGQTYAVKLEKYGWRFTPLDEPHEAHLVTDDATKCSCPDHRFRHRECKHLRYMKQYLRRE